MDGNVPCKVLIVDDDPIILALFSTVLGAEGFDVSTAVSGTEALQRVKGTQVHIALLDINLPDVSGIEVMRQIVKTTSIIVILITGDDARYSHETAVQEGAADFIVKPIRPPELVRRIRQAREIRSLTEAKERLIADLERLAIRDELTGLYNYRHFQAQLKAETQRSLRYQRPLSLIVVDVDHFKVVNDTLGHAQGDRILAGIARGLDGAVRTTDVVFRHGGEEFAILLPETHGDEARGVADRARQAVEQAEPLRVSGRPVTISAGVADFLWTEDHESFLRRADAALYRSKHDGRNRVSMA